jgi:hypothetical protein
MVPEGSIGDVDSDSTPLAMANDGDVGWQCEADENERIDEGGEAGYALTLRVLG